MDKQSFSIIIPIHGERAGVKPVNSILNQTYNPNLREIIIVEDDNANSPYKDFVVSHHDERLERVISFNEGLEKVSNDWIIFLDSDDELVSTTFYNLDYCIRKYPNYKIFHYGGVVYWEPRTPDEEDYNPRTTIRETPDLPKEGRGFFPTGLIASGHFCFHRSLYDELGGFPETTSPYEFAELAVEEFPEFEKMMEDRNVDTLGNPWGQDYYYFYKLTRKYKSKALPLNLYIQHVRR